MAVLKETELVKEANTLLASEESHDDSDLEDLIEVDVSEEKGDTSLLFAANALSGRRINILELICAYLSLFVMSRPKTASAIVVSFLVLVILFVNLTLSNAPPLTPDRMTDQYSAITSKYDLTVGNVDHWCLQGGDEKCRCEDPLQPRRKTAYRNWEKAHEMNKELITNVYDGGEVDDDYYFRENVDVVFLGENIVETWAGRSVSFTSTFATEVKEKFDKKFTKNGGGKFNGLPLGIAGDTAPNVLWRIQNGEMPESLYPSVWWLVLGTNDLAMKQCSEEIVLLGILRVVEEIMEARPYAKIVISSILPMTTDKKGRVPIIKPGKGQKKVDHEKHTEERRQLQEELRRALKRKDKTPSVKVRKSPFAWTRISLWPSVSALNSVLKKFCEKHKHIAFFDAYDIFVDTATDDDIPAVKADMVKSFALGQPSVKGHEALIKSMSQKMTNYHKKWYGDGE